MTPNLPHIPRIGALQVLHFGEDEAEVFGVSPVFAAALHPVVVGGFQGGFFEYGSHFLLPKRPYFREVGRNAGFGHLPVAVVGGAQFAAEHPELVQGRLHFLVAGFRAVAEANHPFGRIAQVVGRFFERFFGNSRQALVAAAEQGFVIEVVVGIEEKLPDDGMRPIGIGLFHKQGVVELVCIAEIGELVFAAALALVFAGIAQQHTRLTEQIERNIGHGDVLFEYRAVTTPFAEALRQHEGVVAELQEILEMCIHVRRLQGYKALRLQGLGVTGLRGYKVAGLASSSAARGITTL